MGDLEAIEPEDQDVDALLRLLDGGDDGGDAGVWLHDQFHKSRSDSATIQARDLKPHSLMTFSLIQQVSGHLAVQLICAVGLSPVRSGSTRRREAMARFSERVTAYLALQKKVEGRPDGAEETPTIRSESRRTSPSLAEGIRAARADAKAGRRLRWCSGSIQADHPRGRQGPLGAGRVCGDAGGPEAHAAAGERRLSGDAALATVPPLILHAPAAAARRCRIPLHGPRPDPARHQSQPDCRCAARSGADGGPLGCADLLATPSSPWSPSRSRRTASRRARPRACPTARTR